MLISIDGEERSELVGEGRTLGEVLGDAKGLLHDSGRMIVGIECDGRVLTAQEVDRSLAEQADKYWQINFQTAVAAHLAQAALEAVRLCLDHIDEMSDEVSQLLSQSQIRSAMQQMGPLFGAWNDAYQGLFNTLTLLGVDPESVELPTGTAASLMGGLTEQLREVKSSLENQDYVQLADILSYELRPLAKDCRVIIDSLLERLTEEDNPAASP